jgi:signal transduction histidine kinase
MRLITTLFALHLALCSLSQQKEIDSIKQALPLQSPLDQVASLNELSWYYKNFDLDSSIVLATEALKIGREIESKQAQAQSLSSLANAYEAKGKLDSALLFHKQSNSYLIVINDSLGIAGSLNNQGIVYDQLGNYTSSLKCYFQALRIYENRSDAPYDVAMVLGNIGIVYKKQKEYKKVLEYYQRALEIYTSEGSDFGQTVTKGNIGSVLLLTKDYNQAINYLMEAKTGYEKLGHIRYVPYMLNNLGVANDSLGNSQKARDLFLQAKEQHLTHNNQFELANTLIALASNYRKTRDHDLGIKSADEALGYAQAIQAKEFEIAALKELSKNYSANGQHFEAFEALERRDLLKDEQFEETKTKQIFELQTQYETEKKQQQIELQNAHISQQELRLERNQLFLIFTILAIIFILAIALLQRNRLKKKQQIKLQKAHLDSKEAEINASISSQEKERARYARDLHDGFGQMISILNMNLKNLQNGAKPDERQKVFEASEKVIDEMYKELKNICFDLMPQTLIKHGLESALKEFTDRINQAEKVFVELNVFGLEERLTELQEISIYRISQEWINNILKYSDADKVTLQITKDEVEITLLIEDNGRGFDKSLLEQGKGNGWKNLNTRAKLIKGELELETEVNTKGNVLILNAIAKGSMEPIEIL